jgi:hypothetical protein
MFIMECSDQVTLQLPYLQDSKSMMLRCHTIPGWDREHIVTIFDTTGNQYLIHECLQPIATLVTQDS